MGSLGRVKSWVAERLTFTDLNAEFDNILNNADTLSSPRASAFDMAGNEITLDGDSDTSITASTDDQIDFELRGVDLFIMDGHTNGTTVVGLKWLAAATGNSVAIQTLGENDRGFDFETAEGEEILKLSPTATAVNEITIASATTNLNPTISASGGSTDTGIDFENEQAEEMLVLEPVASGINHITITNAAAGSNPTIAADGLGVQSDTGIDFENDQGEEILILEPVAAGVNELTITNAGTASNPSIKGTGGTNVGVLIQGKGDRGVVLGDASLEWPDSDGAAGTVLTTDGSAALSFVKATLPRSYLAGVQLTYTDTNTITIGVGEARNSANDTNIVLASTLAKDHNGTWSAGAGGGLNATDFSAGSSGAEASTWYHVFLIEDGSGTVDAGFDKSPVATNLLGDSGYTNFRRIGSVFSDGSENLLSFFQIGNRFYWTVPLIATVASGDHRTGVDETFVNVPPDIEVVASVMAFDDGSWNSSVPIAYTHIDHTSVAPSISAGPGAMFKEGADSFGQILVSYQDQKTHIRTGSGDSSTAHSHVVYWWEDRRGRDD